MFFSYAIAGDWPQQAVVVTRDQLQDIAGTLAVMVLIAILFSYAATAFAKQWRKDHGRRAWSLSSSNTRATVFAAVAFLGEWYAAHSFNIICVNDWGTAGIIAAIIGMASPYTWNPLIGLIGKFSPELASRLDAQQAVVPPSGNERGYMEPIDIVLMAGVLIILLALISLVSWAGVAGHWYCAAATLLIEAYIAAGVLLAFMPGPQGESAKNKLKMILLWLPIVFGWVRP